MRENLQTSLRLMFGHEGGYTNNRADRGNWLNGQLVGTKYGITGATLAGHRNVRQVTADDVRNLTLAEAEAIYRKSYWTQSGGDLLPSGIDYMAFDFGVNSGPSRSIKTLQSVVGVAQDGIVGGQTVAAVNRYPGGIEKLIRDYGAARMSFLRGLKSWSDFSRGWTIRVTGVDPKGQYARRPGVIGDALSMARGSSEQSAAPAIPVPDGKGRDEDTSLVEIAKKPEAWGPLGMLVSAFGAIFSGEGPAQYALAAIMVIGFGVGIWYFIRRMRSQ